MPQKRRFNMKTGDEVVIYLQIADASGDPVQFANYTAFLVDLEPFLFYEDDVPVSLPADFALVNVDEVENAGMHKITWTAEKGDFDLLVNPDNYASDGSIAYTFNWLNANISINNNEIDDMIIALGGGGDLTPMQINLTDESLGNLKMNDSFNTGIITVPLAMISRFGLTDLTGCTISAAFMDEPNGTEVAIDSAIINASERTVKAYKVAFDSDMDLASGEFSKTWYLDIQVIVTATSEKITVGTYSVDVVWERDTT